MSYTATASIIHILFMYYSTCGKNWEFIKFTENVAKLFIDHQQSPNFGLAIGFVGGIFLLAYLIVVFAIEDVKRWLKNE